MPGSVTTAACLQPAWQSAPSVCRAGLDRKISPNRDRRPNHNPPRCTAALGPQLDEQIDLVENRSCDWKRSGPTVFAEPASPPAGEIYPTRSECRACALLHPASVFPPDGPVLVRRFHSTAVPEWLASAVSSSRRVDRRSSCRCPRYLC